MGILTDDENRENEGDLTLAADLSQPSCIFPLRAKDGGVSRSPRPTPGT
jgi:3,4-dihydroxy-2-butanone 4-phosphate synthase